MKDKHLRARIKQCLALAELSNCPRRTPGFGAIAIDPVRNVILVEGYNGGPRGGGNLCGGGFCQRTGPEYKVGDGQTSDTFDVAVRPVRNGEGWATLGIGWDRTRAPVGGSGAAPMSFVSQEAAEAAGQTWVAEQHEYHPPIPSGTNNDIGCHHAEQNVVCNAAAHGTALAGAWLIVNGEPCIMCAKLLHHAGIVKVICVAGGYLGGLAGVEYLR